jgi:hypothetical protein
MILAAAPCVHVTVRVADPSSGVDAFAETGSYAPNPNAPAVIKQLGVTVALTAMLEVAEPA